MAPSKVLETWNRSLRYQKPLLNLFQMELLFSTKLIEPALLKEMIL